MGYLFCLSLHSSRSSNVQAIVIVLGNPLNLTVDLIDKDTKYLSHAYDINSCLLSEYSRLL